MCESTFGCQATVKEPCKFGVVQAVAGKAAGRQLLGECLCTQYQFLPRLFLCLCHALRPALAEQRWEPAAPPGTSSTLRGWDDDIDVPFDERTLGGDLL